MGGFTEAAGALGLPVGLMSGMGGAFSAIKIGDMSALTGAVQGLAGFDAGILGSVAGMADGLPLGGMGAMGGMEVDIASSMNFVQSITKFFECDPEPESSPNDEVTLDSGGNGVEEPNCASIAESANNAAQTAGASLKDVATKAASNFAVPNLNKIKGTLQQGANDLAGTLGDIA